ncbi:type II toxin-antitoxin system VapC family toxin [Candidatus Bathyarchaeota archaeon]|nr:MAG: type II toxin-antitoxin system VapC family toxin [Candidatus Bathyarchaeota archaeon]
MQAAASRLPSPLLVEADLFISYLTSDHLVQHFRPVVDASLEGKLDLLVSSEVYDDVVACLRSQEVPLEKVRAFIQDMRAIPHTALPVTLDVAITALDLYVKHGGSRKLHYFDAFHVATSQLERLPLLTSDRYILEHSSRLGTKTIEVRGIR